MVELRSNNIGRRSSSSAAASSTTRSNRIGGSTSSRLSHSSQLIPMLRYFSLYLLFLAFSAQSASADLLPNYDNAERELLAFDDRTNTPLILSCNIEGGDYKLSWTYKNVDVSESASLRARYRLEGNSFIIDKPDEADAGVYTCSVPSMKWSKTINVVANVYPKYMSESLAVVEGEQLVLKCIVFGTDPEISWLVGNLTLTNSTDRILLTPDENGVKNAVLTINSAELDDRKFYNCSATNDAIKYTNKNFKVETVGVYVRVKGKLAALWPFLGICAEVFILCAIILVYEKRRNKAEMDESDTDQSPEQEKLKVKK